MSKHIQLYIADPCHENWDNMTSIEKGKFCDSCQKQVIDFTKMSDRELAQFFKKPILSLSKDGSTCGRFMKDQLDRSIEIPRKRIPWVKYFFQFLLPAFLISMKATAQGKVKVTTTPYAVSLDNCDVKRTMGKPDLMFDKKLLGDTTHTLIKKQEEPAGLLKGQINLNKEPVTQKIQKENNFQDTITLPEVVIVSYRQQVMGKLSMGTPTQVVADIADTTITFLQQDKNSITAGVVFVCRAPGVEVLKDSIVKQVFKKLVPENFKLYPNPVKAGSSIHIEWKQKATGDFMLQLLNVTGQIVYNKQIWIDDEARLLEFQLPSVVAGNYFLRMTNKQSGKGYTEKIIIE